MNRKTFDKIERLERENRELHHHLNEGSNPHCFSMTMLALLVGLTIGGVFL